MSKISKLIKKFLSRPPEVRFEEVKTLLETFNFKEIRSKGSHHCFENEKGEVIIVPKKAGQKVKRTYVDEIVKLLNLESWENDK